jgi:hypothetical protein
MNAQRLSAHRSDYPAGRNCPTVKVSATSVAVTASHATAGIAAILTAAGNLIRAHRIILRDARGCLAARPD